MPLSKTQVFEALKEGLVSKIQVKKLKELLDQLYFLNDAGFDPTNYGLKFGAPVARRIIDATTNFESIAMGCKILEQVKAVAWNHDIIEQANRCAEVCAKILLTS